MPAAAAAAACSWSVTSSGTASSCRSEQCARFHPSVGLVGAGLPVRADNARAGRHADGLPASGVSRDGDALAVDAVAEVGDRGDDVVEFVEYALDALAPDAPDVGVPRVGGSAAEGRRIEGCGLIAVVDEGTVRGAAVSGRAGVWGCSSVAMSAAFMGEYMRRRRRSDDMSHRIRG